MTADIALSVENLSVSFPMRGRDPAGKKRALLAVDNVSFSIQRGRTLGIVGESGSGKTTAAMALARLVPKLGGQISIDGIDFGALDAAELRRARQRVQIIFQDPYSALNPRLRAGEIVREPLIYAGTTSRAEQDEIIDELFEAVGLRPEQKALFPHQFSGGQRQRIGIARALSTRPSLIICDEPVSALDVAVQSQILNLLKSLQKKFSLTYLFISHDLGVIQHMCDDIAVMYMGQFMEYADRDSFFAAPRHPYSRALLAAVPTIEVGVAPGNIHLVEGAIPDLTQEQTGCRFASRCPHSEAKCGDGVPQLVAAGLHKSAPLGGLHRFACHRMDDLPS
jgi:peptide/nickel transport system ATP-binding protein